MGGREILLNFIHSGHTRITLCFSNFPQSLRSDNDIVKFTFIHPSTIVFTARHDGLSKISIIFDNQKYCIIVHDLAKK